MRPLVEQLLEHARVRVLRDEARAQQLEALARDLRDDRRVVQEPPAAERHQVGELPRRHAQLVLVLARQHRDEEPVVGMLRADAVEGGDIGGAGEAVAGVFQCRVHLAADADHQRQR